MTDRWKVWIASGAVLLLLVLLLIPVILWGRSLDLNQHLGAVVGVPFAALASMLLVVFFEMALGHVTLKFPGMSLEGAAGPVVVWLICFWTLAVSIWLLF